jgi:methyl-accepting chemotaxis protein
MAHDERKRIWVDEFQTRLVRRITAYLALFLIVLVNLLFSWKLLREGVTDVPGQFVDMLGEYLPVGLCLAILVPLMAWDSIRFTHRLVGPMVRFRRAMHDIAEGETVRPIKLREGDYLNELRDDFNHMLDALQRRGVPVLKPDVPVEDPSAKKQPA